MKKHRLNKVDRKEILRRLSSETGDLLARNNARSSLVIAYVFTAAMTGTGLIVSYLLLNVLDYFGVRISDFVGYVIMLGFVYLFGAPAFSGVRHTARAICDGREVSFPEIFAVFGSFKSLAKSYLPLSCFSWLPRFARGKSWWSDLRIAVRTRMTYACFFPHIGNLLLSFATCFIYYIIVVGPRSAIRRELILRRIQYINLKNNERTVKSND